MLWVFDNWKKVLSVVGLGIVVVPILAYQNMQKRLATETPPNTPANTAQALVALDSAPGVKLRWQDCRVPMLIYPNGKEYAADGFLCSYVTWDKYQADKGVFGRMPYSPKMEDFPVLVFGNSTGFDVSGEPVALRRASDGERLWTSPQTFRPGFVVVKDDGFLAYDVTTSKYFDAATWQKDMMGVDPKLSELTPEQIAKMSDEELAKLGIKREKVDPPPVPDKPTEKSGIRGKLEGNKVEVELVAMTGVVNKMSVADIKRSNRIAGSVKIGPSADFALPLPAGLYTIVIIEGNAAQGLGPNGQWTAIKIADQWLDLGGN